MATGAHRVEVLHPGYKDKPTLLSFMATDYDDGKPCGVRHSTVHAACGIIAGNRFDGHLSIHPNPPSAEYPAIPKDDHTRLLSFGKYYFHVINAFDPHARPYPIVSDFRKWSFPHDALPLPWQEAHISSTSTRYSLPKAPKSRDVSCRITGHVYAREQARIVPNGEHRWFISNDMGRYCIGDGTDDENVIDHYDNIIMLRADVHKLWHYMDIGIIPKALDQRQWQWRVRVNCAENYMHMKNLQKEFQNNQVKLLKGIRREFLFARFALNAFRMVRGFTERDTGRRLLSMVENKIWWSHSGSRRGGVDKNRSCFCTFNHHVLPGVVGSSMPSMNGRTDAEERNIKAVTLLIGTNSLFNSLVDYTKQDSFDPHYRTSAGETWPEIAEKRRGLNWRSEKALLQRLLDEKMARDIGNGWAENAAKGFRNERRRMEEHEDQDDRGDHEDDNRPSGQEHSNVMEVRYGNPDPCGSKRRHEQCELDDQGVCVNKRRHDGQMGESPGVCIGVDTQPSWFGEPQPLR